MKQNQKYSFFGRKNNVRQKHFSFTREESGVYYSVNTNKVISVCEICNKDLYEDPSNLEVNSKLYHFDCVVSKLKSVYTLAENQEIMYIGSGRFAIIWLSSSKRRSPEIIRKINLSEVLS